MGLKRVEQMRGHGARHGSRPIVHHCIADVHPARVVSITCETAVGKREIFHWYRRMFAPP